MRISAREPPLRTAADTAGSSRPFAGLEASAFLTELERLRSTVTARLDNPGSHGCVRCERCSGCTFCVDCSSCSRSTHCERCTDCVGASHCRDSAALFGCSHCERCERCSGSAYLVLCTDMTDSTYCFGCVGLSRQDFAVLNVPVPREQYFELVARLRGELGLQR